MYVAALHGHSDCVRCLLDRGHSVALSPEQLVAITDRECRELIDSAPPKSEMPPKGRGCVVS